MIKFIGTQTQLLTDSSIQTATIAECVDYCNSKSILGVDTETEGFDFTCKKMIMFQIGDRDTQFVIDTRHVSIEPLRDILESPQITKIFHNAKFDYKFIKRWSQIDVENIYDTYLAERILHCGKQDHGYSLTKCTERYCNVVLDKKTRNKFVDLRGTPFTIDQITYGANDVVYLIDIWDAQQIKILSSELEEVTSLENKVVKVLSEIEYEGLMIDETRWTKMAEDNVRLAREQELHLDELVLEHPLLHAKYAQPIQADMFTPVEKLRKTSINWSSPMQTLQLFRLLVPKLDDVNGKKLSKYRYKHKLIDEYILYKERTKLANAYGTKFFNYINCDGRVHTNFSQILDTGRMSSSKPNMQQIPSDNTFRNCFIAPSGWVFVSSDYASQELNVIAYGSRDPVWLEALRRGDDLHGVCADLVFEQRWRDADTDLRKQLRTTIKTINFGLAYGMGPHKLSDTLNISVKEASELIDKYFTAFPNIKRFLEMLGKFGKMNGYIRTFKPFKRKRFFDYWDGRNTPPKEMGMIERASKNTPIQGASADMTKLALVKVYNYIQHSKFKDSVKIVMTVHDQIDTICKESVAEDWKTKMTELMEEAAIYIITNGLLKADTTISQTWTK